MGYSVDIYNKGSESTNNSIVRIPVPFASSYVSGSILSSINFSPLPTPNNAYFDQVAGGNGSIIWNIGSIPLPADQIQF